MWREEDSNAALRRFLGMWGRSLSGGGSKALLGLEGGGCCRGDGVCVLCTLRKIWIRGEL